MRSTVLEKLALHAAALEAAITLAQKRNAPLSEVCVLVTRDHTVVVERVDLVKVEPGGAMRARMHTPSSIQLAEVRASDEKLVVANARELVHPWIAGAPNTLKIVFFEEEGIHVVNVQEATVHRIVTRAAQDQPESSSGNGE